MKEVECEGTQIDFVYSADGKDFKTETYLIGKDCCHIQWKDSKENILIIK